jgi:ATP-dependent RNA helicase DOB1
MVSGSLFLRYLQGEAPSSIFINIVLFITYVQTTDQFEGSLIRVFRRLGELLRQMKAAAKVIGNTELEEKFEKASEMLERPNSVIFCSSLYL